MTQIASGGGGGGSAQPRTPKVRPKLPTKSINARINPGTPYRAPRPSPAVSAGLGAVAHAVAPVTHITLPVRVRPTNRTAAQSVARPIATTAQSIGNPFAHMTPPSSHHGGLLGTIEGLPLAGAALHLSAAAARGIGERVLPTLGHVTVNLGKDLYHLPGSTLTGVEELGGAMGGDIISGLEAPFTGRHTDRTAHILEGAVTNDPIVQLVTTGSAKGLENHPLQGILDLTGAEGLVGRAAGAAARSGALGEDLARAAALNRTERLVAPGVEGTRLVRSYSPDVFRKGAQVLAERKNLKLPMRTPLVGDAAKIRAKVAQFYGPEKSRIAAEFHDTAKRLTEAKPRGVVEARVTPVLTSFGGGRDTLQTMLDGLTSERTPGAESLPKADLARLDTHIKNLRGALAKPNLDLDAVETSKASYAQRQAELEAEKAELNMVDEPEAERAELNRYALMRMPGTRFLSKAVTDPQDAAELRATAARVRSARQVLHNVESAPESAAEIDARRLDLEHYERSYQLLKGLRPRKLKGLVIEDPAAHPIASGELKGLRLRAVTDDEIRAHMGDQRVAYVRMTNPDRKRLLTMPDLRADRSAASSATGKSYTGRAARTGDFLPGYDAMRRSQLQDVLDIGSARMERNFIHQFSVDDARFSPHDVRRAAELYEARTGLPVEPLLDRTVGTDSYALVPQAAVDEMRRQLRLEKPGTIGRRLLGLNRAFRNTVLATSTKLPIMHTVENAGRAALTGATPLDYLRARSALREMSPEARTRLEDLATPGGMGGQQQRLNDEDLGRAETHQQRAAILRAAPALVRGWENISHRIIGAQRFIEKHAQQAALGVHMRRQLHEWGESMLDANTSLTRYSQRLAAGYSDPALAQDAAQFLHRTMGQYNNFTATTRAFITRVAPFAPWYLNAARLVLLGLPMGHPLTDAVIQDVNAANADAWNAKHAGLPTDMQSDVALGPGAWLDVGKFTPLGITKQPLEEVGSLVLPQYAGAVHALLGQDPYGSEFRGPDTPFGKNAAPIWSGPAALHAIDQILESFGGPAPILARAFQSHGDTLYNTSMPLLGSVQRKPGTSHGHTGLERAFNPLEPTYFGRASRVKLPSLKLPSLDHPGGSGSSGSPGGIINNSFR